MALERLELGGMDRARYFAPTAICVYLAGICALLVVVSAFLVSVEKAVAVAGVGLFGLLLTGAMGALFWKAQRRELLYTRLATSADSRANFAAVRQAALQAGWRIVREEPACRLDAETTVFQLNAGERIAVQFRDGDVLVACICDPSIGFSLVGRRHCAEHRELLRRCVSGRAA